MSKSLRAVAMYLPQYHPIGENDEYWGKGFTEWRNVVRAKPRFAGHEQPILPADLGFYDLRLAEVREAQAEMARANGLHGFCYYHYWFGGRRLLERPVDEVLELGKPDLPFMLCWANENWTRAWDGGDKEILIQQSYTDQDATDHARDLVPAFSDARYIRVSGKPVFAVYNTDNLPDSKRWSDLFREELHRHGITPYLIRVERYADEDRRAPAALGFDAAMEFQPFSRNLRKWQQTRPELKANLRHRIANKVQKEVRRLQIWRDFDTHYDMAEFVRFDVSQAAPDYTCFPGVCPSWDNTARRPAGKSIIFRNTSPELYQSWLEAKVDAIKPRTPDENLLFINAWNEWAEGNRLEPCANHGHSWLEATKAVLA